EQESRGVFELYSAAADGSSLDKLNSSLVAGGSIDSAEAWMPSPDGAQVAYIADQQVKDRHELFTVPADGSKSPVRVSGSLVSGGDVSSLYWSGDGSSIAFMADKDVDGKMELYAAPRNGGSISKLNGELTSGGNVVSTVWAMQIR